MAPTSDLRLITTTTAATTTNPTPARNRYDAIVVGARAAGASTAMLLAQRGLRVLVVDRGTYGSDTLSTHALMRGAVNQLTRWGLIDELAAAGTPAVAATTFRYGDDELTIEMGDSPLYAPRRTVLDPILVDAARAAGAEFRFETVLSDLVTDPATGRVTGVVLLGIDGSIETITTDLVIGADGLRSRVARKVEAPVTRTGQSAAATIIRYVRNVDLPTDRYHWLYRVNETGDPATDGERRAGGVIPTNDDTFCVFVSMRPEWFADHGRDDTDATHHRVLTELAPEVASAVADGVQVGPTRAWPGHGGQFRQASGPGWALVGDAGYFKDPAAAHGISDAFRDAELLADAVAADDLAGYGAARDELSLPLFERLESLASLAWTMDELPHIHLAVGKAMNDEQDRIAARFDQVPLAA